MAGAVGEDEEVVAETAGKRSYSVPAAEKALDVIELMAGQPGGLTLTELHAGVNLETVKAKTGCEFKVAL